MFYEFESAIDWTFNLRTTQYELVKVSLLKVYISMFSFDITCLSKSKSYSSNPDGEGTSKIIGYA